MCCSQRVNRDQIQCGRAVDQNIFVCGRQFGERVLEARLARQFVDQLHFSAGQFTIGRDHVETADVGMDQHFVYGLGADQDVINRLFQGGLVDPAAGGRVALGIEIDQQHAALGCGQACGQIDAGRGLADTAFLIGNRQYLHAAPSCCNFKKTRCRWASRPGTCKGRTSVVIPLSCASSS